MLRLLRHGEVDALRSEAKRGIGWQRSKASCWTCGRVLVCEDEVQGYN